jgi:integrase
MPSAHFAAEIGDLVKEAGGGGPLDVIAVDIPIGLPDAGRRQAGVLARKLVGPLWAPVFMTPVRPALEAPDYASAAGLSRLREPETAVDRASDEEIVALLGACRSARDRLVVLLMARAGLRRGEACGLRRSDVHLLADSRRLGCEVARAHLHVVRREDNPNGAWAKSRRQRVVPLDFLVVQAFDAHELERMRVPQAAASDFVLVNLFRGRVGAPVRPDAVGELLAAASRRAGLEVPVSPHQLRHAFGSNAADAGAGIDVIADLLGHAAVSSSRVYVHPGSSRLRAAVDAVPSPRERAGGRQWPP